MINAILKKYIFKHAMFHVLVTERLLEPFNGNDREIDRHERFHGNDSFFFYVAERRIRGDK